MSLGSYFLRHASRLRLLSCVSLTLLMAACGGGDEPSSSVTASAARQEAAAYSQLMARQPQANEARRFLAQATFGPTDSLTSAVQQRGYEAWLDEQISAPLVVGQHVDFYNARMAEARAVNASALRDSNYTIFSVWRSALTNEDALRQRVAFALSQIFVVSLMDDCLNSAPQSVASFADMLTARAFGTYRDLLESVAKHPAMGCYLSHLKNRKEDLASGRQPDENFAREIMQLFSIGLVRLNPDGTPFLDAGGMPVDTYSSDDVKGLAKVFTGFSFDCSSTSSYCFWRGVNSATAKAPEDIWTKPMMVYPGQHSSSEKKFLGVTVPANTAAPESLRIALDTLAGHPNVAPFISRQLIQRLVTSNPSSAYVQRVAERFTSSGGNLGEVVKAILLDREARMPSYPGSDSFGKLREPVLRLTALLRATGVDSQTGQYQLTRWMSSTVNLGQVPYLSPSVFNFYRPGYVPPGTDMAEEGLVAPEFQQLDESSFASYINYMQAAIDSGAGIYVPYPDSTQKPDVRPSYLNQQDSALLQAAGSDESLVDITDCP